MNNADNTRPLNIQVLVEGLYNKVQDKESQSVLNYLSSIPKLSYKELLTLFTNYSFMGESVIKSAISRSPQHLQVVLNSSLIFALESENIFNILNAEDSVGDTSLCFTIKKKAPHINALLNSKAFLKLDGNHLYQILKEECEVKHPSLWFLAQKDEDDILAVLNNEAITTKLSDDQKKSVLIKNNNKSMLGSVNSESSLGAIFKSTFMASLSENAKVETFIKLRTVIGKNDKKLLEIFLNNEVLTSLSSANRYKIATAWTERLHILKTLISKNIDIINIFFNSKVFMELSIQWKKKLIFSKGPAFWIDISSETGYVEKLLNNTNLSQELRNYLADEFLKIVQSTGHKVRRKDFFEERIVEIARNYTPYKTLLSEDGYSLLYYLSTNGGFSPTSLRKLINEGFNLTFPKNKNVTINDTHIFYESLKQKKELVVYLRGQDGSYHLNIPVWYLHSISAI